MTSNIISNTILFQNINSPGEIKGIPIIKKYLNFGVNSKGLLALKKAKQEYKEFNLKEIEPKPLIKDYVNIDNLNLNSVFLKQKYGDFQFLVEKLSRYGIFKSFNTLTTKSKDDYQDIINLNKDIISAANEKFNISRIISKNQNVWKKRNNLTSNEIYNKAREIVNKNISKYLEKDINLYHENQLKIFFWKTLYKKYKVKHLTNTQKNHFQEKFKEEYNELIKNSFENKKNAEIANGHLEKLRNKISYKYQHLKTIEEIIYLGVIEFQHNEDKNTHLHILYNTFIPNSLIKEFQTEENKINKNIWLFDTFLHQNKNSLKLEFSDLKTDIEKLKYMSNIFHNDIYKKSFSNSVSKYLTKYLSKDFSNSYLTSLKKGLDGRKLILRSNKLKKIYPELFKENEKKYDKLGVFPPLNSYTQEIKMPRWLDLRQEFSKNPETIRQILKHQGLFENKKNKGFLKIKNNFKTPELLKSDIFENFEFEKELNNEKITLNRGIKEDFETKMLLFDTLQELYNKNLNNELISKDNILDLINNCKFNISKDKLKVLDSISNNPIISIYGNAGTGKTTLISEILKLANEEMNILVLSQNANPLNILRNTISKENKNIKLSTIDKFIENRYYYNVKNENNVFNDNKKYMVIFDEFGQIPYTQLLNFFKSFNIENINKLIFAGDTLQTKSIEGDTILKDFEKLDDIINKHELIETHRFDKKLKIEIEKFQKDRVIKQNYLNYSEEKTKFKNIILEQVKNKKLILTTQNETKDLINNICKDNGFNSFYMCEKNYSKLNFINGQLFEKISENKQMVKLRVFESKSNEEKEFPKELFNEYFNLSYAVTVHKFQGFQYKDIFIYMPELEVLNNFNILNTAITRAKESFEVYFQNPNVYYNCLESKEQNNLFEFKYMKLIENYLVSETSFKKSPPSGMLDIFIGIVEDDNAKQ